MKTILILKGPGETEMLVDVLALRWTRWGHRVTTHHGASGVPDADVVVLHVDSTRVPARYPHALREHPAVVNRHALDISKLRYSQLGVRRDDDYAGPVIVKTTRNFGGEPEHLRRGPLARLRPRGWRWIDTLDPLEYPLFDSKDHVPAGVWTNRNLLVERFVPEREEELYFVRYWLFFGDQGWACRFGSEKAIAKFHTRVTDEQPVEVPGDLIALRRRLGVDYGRIDYVEHDGRPLVFDVNKTLGGGGDLSQWADQIDTMASGIDAFLASPVRA